MAKAAPKKSSAKGGAKTAPKAAPKASAPPAPAFTPPPTPSVPPGPPPMPYYVPPINEDLLLQVQKAMANPGYFWTTNGDVNPLVEQGFCESLGTDPTHGVCVKITAKGLAKLTGDEGEGEEDEAPAAPPPPVPGVPFAPFNPAAQPQAADPRNSGGEQPVSPGGLTVRLGPPPQRQKRMPADRKSRYNFADLAPPQRDANGEIVGVAYIFVPATADMPNPSRSLASLVASAEKKFARETGEKRMMTKRDGSQVEVPVLEREREFQIEPWTEDGAKGARIMRIR